jgi:hypothetical protein
MTTDKQIETIDGQIRHIDVAKPFDKELGPFGTLPGRWVGRGRGWNMIALPFAQPGPLDYRLLLNQYDEELNFSLVDKGVPNRGVSADQQTQTDQRVVTLDYEQVVHQVAVVDEPASLETGLPGAAIHHEPGLFLNMKNRIPDGFDIARLGTIPHGDAVLALGKSSVEQGLAPIRPVDGLPIGVSHDLVNNRYLSPYKHFHDNPFKGNVGFPGFQGFDPVAPHLLLEAATAGQTVTQTTVLDFDSSHPTGGIKNIPFVVRKADAASMKATFWIQQLAPEPDGLVVLQMQYVQVVMLDFFPKRDGLPGRISWPHVSINTLTKVSDDVATNDELTTANAAARVTP